MNADRTAVESGHDLCELVRPLSCMCECCDFGKSWLRHVQENRRWYEAGAVKMLLLCVVSFNLYVSRLLGIKHVSTN
jgi:hypothetical protein